MTDSTAIPSILSTHRQHAGHPLLVVASVAAGAYVGYRTKDTLFGQIVGALIWIGLGLFIWACLVVGLIDEPLHPANVFTAPLFTWLGWSAIWIGIRPSVGRPLEVEPRTTNLVAYGQATYDCCRHCASCTVRDVDATPCSCSGQTALRAGRG